MDNAEAMYFNLDVQCNEFCEIQNNFRDSGTFSEKDRL